MVVQTWNVAAMPDVAAGAGECKLQNDYSTSMIHHRSFHKVLPEGEGFALGSCRWSRPCPASQFEGFPEGPLVEIGGLGLLDPPRRPALAQRSA